MKLEKNEIIFTKKELKILAAKNPTILSVCKLLEKEGFGRFNNPDVRQKRFEIFGCATCAPYAIFRHYRNKIEDKTGIDICESMCTGFYCHCFVDREGKHYEYGGRSCYAHRFNDIMTGQIQKGRNTNAIDDGDIIFKNCIKVV